MPAQMRGGEETPARARRAVHRSRNAPAAVQRGSARSAIVPDSRRRKHSHRRRHHLDAGGGEFMDRAPHMRGVGHQNDAMYSAGLEQHPHRNCSRFRRYRRTDRPPSAGRSRSSAAAWRAWRPASMRKPVTRIGRPVLRATIGAVAQSLEQQRARPPDRRIPAQASAVRRRPGSRWQLRPAARAQIQRRVDLGQARQEHRTPPASTAATANPSRAPGRRAPPVGGDGSGTRPTMATSMRSGGRKNDALDECLESQQYPHGASPSAPIQPVPAVEEQAVSGDAQGEQCQRGGNDLEHFVKPEPVHRCVQPVHKRPRVGRYLHP